MAERNTRYETGPNVVMNSATHNDGKKMWLAAGQESHCQVYNIEENVVVVENGKILKKNDVSNGEDVRQRKKKNTVKKDDKIKDKEFHKKLQLIFKPSDSTQTDFG